MRGAEIGPCLVCSTSTWLIAVAVCEFRVDFCKVDLDLQTLNPLEVSSLSLHLSSSRPSLPPKGLCRGPVEYDVQKSSKLSLAQPFSSFSLCAALPLRLASPPTATHPILPHLILNMGKFWGNFK